MKAIISDIHANWEALQSVLHDAAQMGAKEIYCLGDLVGYGPNPRECLDLLEQLELSVVLQGNHDEAILRDPLGFNPRAAAALRWTKKELLSPLPERNAPQRRRMYLEKLPQTHQEGDLLFVHGSPRDPLREYVFPEDKYNARKMGDIFDRVRRCCFAGHTHVPGVFTQDRRFLTPEELGDGFRLDDTKAFCNVGSVGQPRDGDLRACYVLFDGEVIRYRRVEYDITSTVAKIRAIAELDDSLWKQNFKD